MTYQVNERSWTAEDGAQIKLYPAATNRSGRDQFYAFRNSRHVDRSVREFGYASLDEAKAAIEATANRVAA